MIFQRGQKYPEFKQLDQMDCGPTCLRMIAKYHGKDVSLEQLRGSSSINKEGVSLIGLTEASENIGLKSIPVKISLKVLSKEAPLPCILFWEQSHYVVLYEINDKECTIADPRFGLRKIDLATVKKNWIGSGDKGYVLLSEATPKFYEGGENHAQNKGFRFLLPYFKPYKKEIYQVLAGLLFASLLQLILPFLTQAIVDYGINYRDLNFIYLILVAQIVVFISRASVEYIRGWILLFLTKRVNISLVSDFLAKLMTLPISFFEARHGGDIIQRIVDNKKVQDFLSSSTLVMVFSLFTIVIFGIVLLIYSFSIFLAFLIGSLLYVFWAISFLKKRAEIDSLEFKESANNQKNLYQLIFGINEIKINGSEKKRKWEWEEIQVRLFKVSSKGLELSQKQNFGALFINEFSNIIITFLSAKLVIEGNISLGAMLSIQYIIGQLNLPLSNLVSFLQISQDTTLSLERLMEIHMIDSENEAGGAILNNASDVDIEIRDLSFRYGSNASPMVVKKVNLDIKHGQTTAIVGMSGGGKTTLVKLLLKYYENYTGKVSIGDFELLDLDTKQWRKNCGAVMQDGYIFNDSILSNITESQSEISIKSELLEKAIKIANLEETIAKFPKGLDTEIGPDGMSLSGGEKQRILIARMVYKNPWFIILDEATSSLDAHNEKKITENLTEFIKGRTVLVIAHRLSTVKNADMIYLLDEGEIIEGGKHSELIKLKGKYYNLIKNQLEIGS